MKQTVTLLFPSYVHLWEFIESAGLSSFELNSGSLLLYCECTEAQIQLAVSVYGATIITP